jgi:hypothetical protein
MNKKVEPQDRRILLSETVELGEKTEKGQIVTDPNVLFNEMEREASFLTGSEVIRAAIKRANLDMSVAYPITPQSEAAALIGELYAEGYVREYFRGENEFAVMGECAGAAFGGARVFTRCRFRWSTGVHHHCRTGNLARHGELSHVGRVSITDSSLRDLPGHQLSPEYSAGHHGNVLPSGNGYAGLARGNCTGSI